MTAPVMVGPSPNGGGPVPSPDWEEFLADIGDRIRAERQARRWTQTELARRAGVSLCTIKRLEEAGITYLPMFVRVCTVLGILETVFTDQWQLPQERPYLSPQQARVLAEVADGKPLAEAARSLHMTPGGVASVLTAVYRRLGVSDWPRKVRRDAAVRTARRYGLIDAA